MLVVPPPDGTGPFNVTVKVVGEFVEPVVEPDKV
jgi:hypothetical protein